MRQVSFAKISQASCKQKEFNFNSMDKIKLGEYIIVQRNDLTKLIKFDRLETQITIGRDMVELRNIQGNEFFKTFKMKLKEGGSKKKRLYELELCENTNDIKDILKSFESGADNRNLKDTQDSQSLPFAEIEKMKDTKGDAKEIIETIVANSKTFNQKTEFSQEKYLKKKEKKYFEYIQIRKPTIRLLAHIYYRQDHEKILGMRMDSLSQIISYAGVNSSGKYLLYDAGSCGLVTAAFLNSMGPHGDAKLVVMHPGNFSQKQAVFALNLDEKQMSKCVSVNIYSVLRQFYQGTSDVSDNECEEPSEAKKIKLDEENEANGNHKQKSKQNSQKLRRQKWKEENEEALEILREKVDGVTIISKEDPFPIIKELLPFVHPGRPIVIFHHCKELLMECFQSMKQLNCAVNLRLFSTFMRNIQVLPRRTHPYVQIQGSSGFLLAGYAINTTKSEVNE